MLRCEKQPWQRVANHETNNAIRHELHKAVGTSVVQKQGRALNVTEQVLNYVMGYRVARGQ